MRRINEIIVHCTATPEGMPMTVKRIDEIHRDEKHWFGIGYHIVIYLDGTIHNGRLGHHLQRTPPTLVLGLIHPTNYFIPTL